MKTPERSQQASKHFDWWKLVRYAGVGVVVLLGAAAVGLHDIEAAALAVAGVCALFLMRWRTGLAGLLALGVLFADVAAWMVPGAISNLSHRESWVATALPSTLAIVAVSGLIGVSVSLVGRRMRFAEGTLAFTIAVVAGIAIVVVNVAGVLAEADRASPVHEGDVYLEARQVKFDDTTIEADAGEIGVVVSNKDLFWHTFTISKLGVNLKVPVRAERRITFAAEPGIYEFVCAIPGHVQAGMKGTLTAR